MPLMLVVLCPLSAPTKLTVSPGSIFTCAGYTITPPSDSLFSILTSICGRSSEVRTVSIAAASRSSAMCVVISCRLALTDFDDIQDV